MATNLEGVQGRQAAGGLGRVRRLEERGTVEVELPQAGVRSQRGQQRSVPLSAAVCTGSEVGSG